jgi:hypothetical protein
MRTASDIHPVHRSVVPTDQFPTNTYINARYESESRRMFSKLFSTALLAFTLLSLGQGAVSVPQIVSTCASLYLPPVRELSSPQAYIFRSDGLVMH